MNHPRVQADQRASRIRPGLAFRPIFLAVSVAMKSCRCARIDQEIERALAVDPRPDQEVVGIGEPVRHLKRLADLRVVLWCWRPALPLSQGIRPWSKSAPALTAARIATNRHAIRVMGLLPG